jgi:hypothetical protein
MIIVMSVLVPAVVYRRSIGRAQVTQIQLLKGLLSDPARTLEVVTAWESHYTKTDRTRFDASGNLSYAATIESARTLRTSFEPKCPLFLMAECVTEGRRICKLGRAYCPNYRAVFGAAASGDLVSAIDRMHPVPVQYVGYASGGNYQDLVILTRALTQRPNAQLVIHLVDLSNRYSVQLRDAIGVSRAVSLTEGIDTLHENTRAAIESIVAADGNPGIRFVKQFARGVERNEARHVQFLMFLKRAFPTAHITLHMHDIAESYLALVKASRFPHPDVITLADAENFASRDNTQMPASYAYAQLCLVTLTHSPASTNVCLAKKDVKGNANLVRLALENGDLVPVVTDIPYKYTFSIQAVMNALADDDYPTMS